MTNKKQFLVSFTFPSLLTYYKQLDGLNNKNVEKVS